MLDLLPLFSPSSMLMRPNNGAVHIVDFPIYLTRSIRVLLKLREHFRPYPCFAPPVKATCHRRPWPIVFWQITPWRSCAKYPQDTVYDSSVLLCWASGLRFFWWQQRFKTIPLFICQFMSSHNRRNNQFHQLCKHALVKRAAVNATRTCVKAVVLVSSYYYFMKGRAAK